MAEDDEELVGLGSLSEQITDHSYVPDAFVIDNWDRVLKCPHVCAESEEQIKRILRIHFAVVSAAAVFLRLCPNSTELERAIYALQDAKIQAISAIQVHE